MKERVVTLALLAAVTVGVAPAFSQTSDSASIINGDNLIADGMIEKRTYRRTYKKVAQRAAKKAEPAPAVVEQTQTTIEEPVAAQPVVEETKVVEQKVVQPAVVETCQPVIIDRFEKRHRSLLHLGLFPFALFR